MRTFRVLTIAAFAFVAVQLFLQGSLIKTLQLKVQTQEQALQQVDALEHQIDSLQRKLTELRDVDDPTGAAARQREQTTGAKIISRAEYSPAGSERDDPFYGPKDSDVLLMAFLDFQCKPCRTFAQESLPKLKQRFFDTGKARFLLRDFPLRSHSAAVPAARFAHCAGEQGAYWEAFSLLFSDEGQAALAQDRLPSLAEGFSIPKRKRFQRCLASDRYEREVADDKAEGRMIGAVGVPNFFVGVRRNDGPYKGVFIRGAQPYAVFEQQLSRMLAETRDD